jgi:hypothetical protein
MVHSNWRHPSPDEFHEDDDESDGEFIDDDDLPDDESVELLPCPECGADVYEDAEQCPVCGAFIIDDTNLWTGRSTWWIVLGLLGIIAVVLALGLPF